MLGGRWRENGERWRRALAKSIQESCGRGAAPSNGAAYMPWAEPDAARRFLDRVRVLTASPSERVAGGGVMKPLRADALDLRRVLELGGARDDGVRLSEGRMLCDGVMNEPMPEGVDGSLVPLRRPAASSVEQFPSPVVLLSL
jgi:hypothetical protein